MHNVPAPCAFAFVFRSQAAGKTVTVTAVSAATITFTANSMIFCFFIRFVFFRGRRNEALGFTACYRRDARRRLLRRRIVRP